MSYQVLARKWRPRNFAELVGQEHVVRALVNALQHDRLHHAYLFTGTRGVGKTTIARILAKSLNCMQGVSATPCGVCAACQEIDEGRFVDLLEVDAASRTKVEDTRELLENVQYAPTHGRYKVYLIDEVHMLSTHSFNALLKTLEEPPPHVKFLLATTDPQRLPITVLSRCLQFNLKRLPTALIAARLGAILAQEGIDYEPGALQLLARAGDGSLRDALSLLDQAIAYGGGRVTLADVSTMLGSIEQRHVLHILEALAAGDAAAVLQAVTALDEMAPDYGTALAEIELAVAAHRPAATASCCTHGRPSARPGGGAGTGRTAGSGRCATVLSDRPDRAARPATVARTPQWLRNDPAAHVVFPPAGPAPTPVTARYAPAPTPAAPLPTPVPVATLAGAADWNAVVAALDLGGAVKQLALHCALQSRDGATLHLLLAPENAHLRSKNFEERLCAALREYYGEPALRLHIQIVDDAIATPAHRQAEHAAEQRQTALETIQRDPNVRALCDTFDGQVKPDSITRLK